MARRVHGRRYGPVMIALGLLVWLSASAWSPAAAQPPDETIAVVAADDSGQPRLVFIDDGRQTTVDGVEAPRAVDAYGRTVVVLTHDRLMTVAPSTAEIIIDVPLAGEGRSLAVDEQAGHALVITTAGGRWQLATVDLRAGQLASPGRCIRPRRRADHQVRLRNRSLRPPRARRT